MCDKKNCVKLFMSGLRRRGGWSGWGGQRVESGRAHLKELKWEQPLSKLAINGRKQPAAALEAKK